MPTVARLSLQVDVDGGPAAIAQLEAIDRALKSHAARWSQMSGRFVADTDDQGAAMTRLTRTVETSHTRIVRSGDNVERSHRRLGGSFGAVGQQMARMAASGALLTTAATTLGPALFQVGVALAPVVGLAGALPGLLVSGGVAAATAKLAFTGIGDALKAMSAAQDGTAASAEKLAEAMEALPPAARPVVRQLFEMRDMVTQLRTTAAAGIMPGVADVLRSLQGLFPIVKREIGETADVMGRLATMTANWTNTPLFRRDFQTIIGTSSTLTANFGRAGLSLARAFVDVAVVAEPLVRQFGRLVELGGRWVEHATRSGRETGAMGRFFQRAGQVAEDLWSILMDVFTIIGNLGKIAAPAGQGILATIKDWADRAARFSQNLEDLEKWVLRVADAFVILRVAMITTALAATVSLGPWGLVIGLLAGALFVLYRRSEAFRDAISKLGGFLRDTLVPIFQSLVAWVRDKFIPAIEQVIPMVRDNLEPAIKRLSDAFTENKDELALVGGMIVKVGEWILLRLVPALIVVGSWIGARLIDAITGSIQSIGDMVRAIQGFIGWVQRTINQVRGFVVAVRSAWDTALRVTRETWESIKDAIREAVETTRVFLERTWNRIVGFLTAANATIRRITKAAWDWVFELIVGNIRRVVDEVRKSIVGQIPRQVKEAWERVKDATAEAWQRVRTIVGDAIRRVLRVLGDAWAAMLRAVRDAWGRFANIIRDAWDTATTRTRDAWNRMRGSITDGIRRVMDTIRGWGRSLGDFFSNIIRRATGWGRDLWRNVRDGIGSIDIGGVVQRGLNAAIRLINSFGRTFARGANIILPGSPIQWPGIGTLGGGGGGGGGAGGGAKVMQTGGLIPGPPRGDRVPILAEGGEVMIRQQVAGPLQGLLLALNRLPGSAARALARELAGRQVTPTGAPRSLSQAEMLLGGDAGNAGLLYRYGNQVQRLQHGGAVVSGGGPSGLGVPGPIAARISRTLGWARSQDPKPYGWGAVGPGAYDCSGFWSAIVNHLTGSPVHSRRFATGSFSPGRGAGGFVPGLGTVAVGVRHGNPGHMAGTMAGVNLESRGSQGVVVGPAARGADNSLFTMRFHLPWAGNQFISGGSGGIDFLGLLSRLLGRVTRPFTAGLRGALGSGSNDLLGGLFGGMGGMLTSGLGQAIRSGLGSFGMAGGGIIREPVVGMGRRSGSLYQFGERGPETVTPGVGGGSTQVFNFNVSLTGTLAEPIGMGDVHRAIGEAVSMLRAGRARAVGVGRI